MKQIEDSKQDIDKYLEDMAVSGWFSIMLICVQGKGRDGVLRAHLQLLSGRPCTI